MSIKKALACEKSHLIIDLMGEEEEYPSYYRDLVSAFMKHDVNTIEKVAKSICDCIDYNHGWKMRTIQKVKETLGVSIR